jgi:SAM-dependent methyltransferase
VLADVQNRFYHPRGKYASTEYRFPYEAESFDFVFLTSVFTHLLPAEVAHYTGEIARVLRPGGRCFITFFLLNPESIARIGTPGAAFDFRYPLDGCRVLNERVPEEAVAYEETTIRPLFARHRLRLIEPIHYGAWCGRERFLDFQDAILACKE